MDQMVSGLREKNGLRLTVTKSGFSLLELVVAIAIIGLMAAVIVPQLRRPGPKEERKQFISQLNALTKFAWQNAITSGKIQQIDFDFEKKVVSILQASGKKKKDGKLPVVPLEKKYTRTKIKIPEQLVVINFYIEGFDETTRSPGPLLGAYFYIVPEGLAQSVVINFVATKEKVAGKAKEVGLILNPFSAQFEVYGTFKKP